MKRKTKKKKSIYGDYKFKFIVSERLNKITHDDDPFIIEKLRVANEHLKMRRLPE